MRPSRAERMQAIYDQVPPMADCQGICWVSCGPAEITPWERRQLALAGYPVTPEATARRYVTDFWCEALGPDGRCRAYDIRPLVCRLWGTVEWLPCPAGCMPEGGWLPNETALRLMLEASELGGSGEPVADEMRAMLADPVWVAAYARFLASRETCESSRHRRYRGVLPVEITSRR